MAIKLEFLIRIVERFTHIILKYIVNMSGFGGLGVACWPLVPKFAGEKNPQHAFLRRGNKAVGPMS